MKTEKFKLWDSVPGMCEETPCLTAYIPENKESDCAIIICPGGGYGMRANHEGEGYAEFFAKHNILSFVLDYRVAPHQFPLPLLDARRAVRFVRKNAEKFGVDKEKIAIMGSSAGGHLAALTSTYYEKIEFEGIDDTDKEDFVPNAQILCYPVIKLLGQGVAHLGSGRALLGSERQVKMGESLSPDLIATKKAPKAFIWHTFEDGSVNVLNSLDYAKRLKSVGVETEMHIFPRGGHGMGLATGEGDVEKSVSQWSELLINWLRLEKFI